MISFHTVLVVGINRFYTVFTSAEVPHVCLKLFTDCVCLTMFYAEKPKTYTWCDQEASIIPAAYKRTLQENDYLNV